MQWPRLLLSDLDDAALAARIASGDEGAFVVAYDRHAGFVFSSVVRFLGDRETAGEVVQDAFVTLWRRARQFDAGSGSLLTWLLAIARHRAIDRLRAEGRRPSRDAISLDAVGPDGRPTRTVERGEAPPELVSDAATDPGAIASRRWVQAVVRTGIAELPEQEREVLHPRLRARPLPVPDRRPPRLADRDGQVPDATGARPAACAARQPARAARGGRSRIPASGVRPMMPMDHAAAHDRIEDLLLEPTRLAGLETSTAPEDVALRDHVAGCAACRADLERLARAPAFDRPRHCPRPSRVRRAAIQPIELPPSLRAATVDAIRRSQPRSVVTALRPVRQRPRLVAWVSLAASIVVLVGAGLVTVDQVAQRSAAEADARALTGALAAVDRVLAEPEHRAVALRTLGRRARPARSRGRATTSSC